MNVSSVLRSVTEGINGRFDAIGFDAPDSLMVGEVRPADGTALLEDEQGNTFLLRVEEA